MSDLSSTVGSMITSFLGPCKNHKFIIDDKEVHIVRCPQHLFEKAVFMDPFSYLVENTLQSHHKQFGCSSTSLLAMWDFWNKEFQSILAEGYDVLDVIKHSQDILDDVINLLPEITMNVEQLFLDIYNKEEMPSCYDANIPTRIGYSSRHYSPSSVQSELTSECLETIKGKKAFRRTVSAIVHKLSHDDLQCSEVVSELWFQQIFCTNHLKFLKEVLILNMFILVTILQLT